MRIKPARGHEQRGLARTKRTHGTAVLLLAQNVAADAGRVEKRNRKLNENAIVFGQRHLGVREALARFIHADGVLNDRAF